MQRAIKWFLSLLGSIAFLCGGFVILHGSLPPASINAWLPAGNLTAARAGAASVLLQDGRLLITGGNGASGALATTEILDPSNGFTAGPPMNFARAHHVAVLLQDGRVLVAGGTDASGAASQSAELFDPAANSWSAAGPLMVGRSGATATLLASGQVLIAGGSANGAALASLELFDPNSNTFTSAAGVLSSARENHAAAPLPDGRVIILGGWDGTTQQSQSGPGGLNVLATTDIFDPSTGAVASGPAMTSPRMNFTATTALDGSVVAIGGTDGVNDLASIDVLIPGAGAFALSGAQLTTARQGHLAFLLPHNGNILVVGGTSGGASLSSAELYTPWTGATSVTGAMASARSGATGSPLFQTVLTAPVGIDGALLVAGGLDASSPPTTLSSAEVYGFATIKTDQSDYPPGVPVTITGSGWQPGEVVQMSLVEVPDLDGDSPIALTATADANGNIINTSFSTNIEDANIHFTLTAIGGASQAQTTFTDGSATVSGTVKSSAAGNPAIVGATVACTSGCNGTPSTTSGAGGAYSLSVNYSGSSGSITLTASASGFAPTTVSGVSVSNGNTTTQNFFLGPGTPPTFTSVDHTTFTVGTAGSFDVTASGVPAPAFSYTGSLPSGVTLSPAGLLSGTPDSGTYGTYNITITASNGALPNATQAFTLTVNKVTTAFTGLTGSQTIVYGQSPIPISLSGRMTGYPSTPGPISINIDGVADSSVPLNGVPNNFGPVSFNTSTIAASAVPYPITYSFSGDINNLSTSDASTTLTVNKAATSTAITSDSPDPSDVGQSVTVNYHVSVTAPGAGTPTGNVTVSDGVDSCTGTVAAGTCNITLTTAGARTLTATYAGDSNFNASTSPGESHQVNNPDSTAPKVTITFPAPVHGLAGWYNAQDTVPVAGSVTADDTATGGSNITAINCTGATVGAISGLNTTSASASLTVSGDGTHSVSCTATDSAGNTGAGPGSTTMPVTIKIDTAAPVITWNSGADSCSLVGNAGWCRGTQTAAFTATDATSGLADTSQASFTKSTTTNGSAVNIASGTVADVAGNVAASIDAGPYKIDSVAPVITWNSAGDSCSLVGLNGWCRGTQTAAFTASDATSGLATPSQASFPQSTGTNGSAVTIASGTVADVAGNVAASIDAGPYKIDSVAPTITLTTPLDGASYVLNQVVDAAYTCSDSTSGITATNCVGTVANGTAINTASVGSKSFTVNATDNAGNTATATHNYSVAYNVCLLYDPTRAVKSGATYPIKLYACDINGADVSSSSIVLHATGVSVYLSGVAGALDDAGNANPDYDFRYDATLGPSGGYIFNLKTNGYGTGTYVVHFMISGEAPNTDHIAGFGVK